MLQIPQSAEVETAYCEGGDTDNPILSTSSKAGLLKKPSPLLEGSRHSEVKKEM
jgi:hypothetical protein